jgi:hypothetical protein
MELLRGFFEIGDDDSPQAARNKIAGALLLLDRELEPSLPLIFELLGVPDAERPAPELADDIRERRMFDIVRRVIRARSEKEPGVILIEDLHWIDPASEAFIQHLIDVVPDTRTLLLLNFRPEYRADWMQRSTYRQLPLRPLGREEVDELLRDLLGRIRERTAGNPFFIEELVRHLADDGRLEGVRGSYTPAGPIEEVEIPPTVQPLLAARIDRLAEREKQVLQAASVLGDQSSESVLRDVLDLGEEELGDALRDLVTGEFLRETALYPEPEYDFLHPLTAEVAYGAQLSDHRARLHGRAARALEARTDEKSRSERAPLLAHHWDAAGETLKAARWHGLAADRMGGAHVPECHRHWSRVRELADTLPDDEEARNLGTMARIQLFVTGARVGRPEEEMEQLFRECSEIVGSGNDAFRARLLTAYSFYRMFVTANVAEAQDLALEARKLAERAGDPVLELGTRFALCNTYAGSDVTAALETAESTLEMLRRDPLLEGTMLPGSIRADVVFRFVRVVTQHMAALGGRPHARRAEGPGLRRRLRLGARPHRRQDAGPGARRRGGGRARGGARPRGRRGNGQPQPDRDRAGGYRRGAIGAGPLRRGARSLRARPPAAPRETSVPADGAAHALPPGAPPPAARRARPGRRGEPGVHRLHPAQWAGGG